MTLSQHKIIMSSHSSLFPSMCTEFHLRITDTKKIEKVIFEMIEIENEEAIHKRKRICPDSWNSTYSSSFATAHRSRSGKLVSDTAQVALS